MLINSCPAYFFKVFCVSNSNYKISKVVRILEKALIYHPVNLRVVFDEIVLGNLKMIYYFLINQSDILTKKAVSNFIANFIITVIKFYDIDFVTASQAKIDNKD